MDEREPMPKPPAFQSRDFRKSRLSTESGNNCVLVARRSGWVEVRDSKREFGAADDVRLVFTAEQFDGFLADIRDGGVADRCIAVTARADGLNVVLSTVAQPGGKALLFTNDELFAFYDGVRNDEFTEAAYAA